MPIRYRSKIDTWLIVVIAIAFFISLLSIILELLTPDALQQGGWISIIIVVVVWAFVGSLIWPLYSEITPSELVVRSGFLHWNMLASPALSLDRLRIEHNQNGKTRFMLISPKDKPGFLRTLAQNAGDFELRDDSIVRLA